MHGKDAAGNWGPLTATTFVVDKSAPTVAATLAQNQATQASAGPVTLTVNVTDVGNPPSPITAAEWFEGADPGVGLATKLTLTAGAFSGTLPLASGRFHTLSVRALDAAGNWSAVATTNQLYVDPIFADTFGTSPFGTTGSGAAWTGGTAGGPSYPLAPAGMNGRYAMLTANNANNSNVTTPILTAAANNGPAGTYRARFMFRNQGPNNANGTTTILSTTSTGWVNVLGLRSGNTDLVDVQYHRTASNNGTLRVAVRTNGFGSTYRISSNTVTLGNDGAVHTIRVAFTAGGAVTLQVDTGTVTTMTFATNPVTTGATVDRAVLGTSTGTTAAGGNGAVTGRAYFDYFEARRNSQP